MFEIGRLAALEIAILLGSSLIGCGERVEATREVRRVTDLIRLFEESRVKKTKTVAANVWSLDGDSRAAIFQHPPGRLVFGPIEPGTDCVFRFGLGFSEKAWGKTDGVEFRASILIEGLEEVIFKEYLEPDTPSNRAWLDREALIPTNPEGPFSIVLETLPGATRKWDHAGWASPNLSCEVVSRKAKSNSDRPNVVLISIDTLRPDHLSVYGYSRPTSPNLEAFAKDSVVFENVFSQAPHTLPSHASILTGYYPAQHQAGHAFPEAPLPESATTLAERLEQSGYRSIAFTAGGMASNRYGLGQGFSEWTERIAANLQSMLPAVYDGLFRVGSDPFFLFLHTYDVHGPYEQPRAHRYFQEDSESLGSDSGEWRTLIENPAHIYQKFSRFSSLGEVVAAYDSGIRFADSQIGELFEYLKKTGQYDNSLIIVTSDHGESLFERKLYISHAYSLYDAEIRVPLVVKLPGARSIGRREDFRELVDIYPMILAETGLESASDLPGGSPFARGSDSVERDSVRGEASHTGARYLRTSRWKLISETSNAWERRGQILSDVADTFETGWQLYDMTADPAERFNLIGYSEKHPKRIRHLIKQLQSFELPGRRVGTAKEPNGAEAEALRSLGYLQ